MNMSRRVCLFESNAGRWESRARNAKMLKTSLRRFHLLEINCANNHTGFRLCRGHRLQTRVRAGHVAPAARGHLTGPVPSRPSARLAGLRPAGPRLGRSSLVWKNHPGTHRGRPWAPKPGGTEAYTQPVAARAAPERTHLGRLLTCAARVGAAEGRR